MDITFLGATGTVTGSMYLVTCGSKTVLVDCGLFQGFKPLRLKSWAPLPIPPWHIEAVILTHAHIDHSGYLPLLVKHGVDAAFSGHDHTYERTKPQKGVQYFVSGAGSKPRHGDLDRRSPLFVSGYDETSSFMSIDVTPERFSFKTIDIGGRVIDSGELAPRAAARAASLKA